MLSTTCFLEREPPMIDDNGSLDKKDNTGVNTRVNTGDNTGDYTGDNT